MKKIEYRSMGNIRASDEEGVCEAHLTKWETVDSWNTKFEAGSFRESFEKRGADGIRLFWNHRELCGKILEVREDDYGPYARCQFNLSTDVGRNAYEHVRAGDVNCFSFGFNTLQDRWDKGVRSIQKVDVMECGPVVFQANDEAKITNVRAENEQPQLNDFINELINGIEQVSIEKRDINEESIAIIDSKISEFHKRTVDFMNEYIGNAIDFGCKNNLQHVTERLGKRSDILANTTLTADEYETLLKGDILPIESRSKLKDMPEELRKAHNELRRDKVESLCDELRQGGFTDFEKKRFTALIGDIKDGEQRDNKESIDSLIDFLKEYRNQKL